MEHSLPLALSLLAGWDHFARRRRSVLVATKAGLHLVAIRGQRASLSHEWGVDTEARLLLRPDKPEVPLELPGWTGMFMAPTSNERSELFVTEEANRCENFAD